MCIFKMMVEREGIQPIRILLKFEGIYILVNIVGS